MGPQTFFALEGKVWHRNYLSSFCLIYIAACIFLENTVDSRPHVKMNAVRQRSLQRVCCCDNLKYVFLQDEYLSCFQWMPVHFRESLAHVL